MPDNADEDVHMAIERALTERIGAAGARLHTGAAATTRWPPTCACTCAASPNARTRRSPRLQELLVARADDHLETVMPGYTHLQRAQVTSAGAPPAGVLLDARARPHAARGRPSGRLELPLGAGAAVGLDFALDREAEAAELGFARVAENSLDAVSDRDFVLDYLASAARWARTSRAWARSSSCGRATSSASCACPTRTPAARASCRRRRTRTSPSSCGPPLRG